VSLRVLVADDEAPARAKLRRYLEAAPGFELAGEADGGREALALAARLRPDVLFLDIRMPDLDGFEVLQALGEEALPAEVVFVTAHGDYALQAFEVHAFDYLLKPVSPERFERLLQRLRERVAPRRDLGPRLDRLLDALPAPTHYAAHLLVESEGRAELVAVDRISRIEADRNYLHIHAEGRRHRLRGTLERMQGRLDPACFVRINRSTLVRLEAIRELAPWPEGEYRLRLDDGSRVTWTRRYLDQAPPSLLRRL
jgi:two-component system LytT family response regulator